MKSSHSKKSKLPAKQSAAHLAAKADEAEKQAEAARKLSRLAKDRFKDARKAFKHAKKLAKQTRKEAKAAAKALKEQRRRRTKSPRKKVAAPAISAPVLHRKVPSRARPEPLKTVQSIDPIESPTLDATPSIAELRSDIAKA